MKPHAHNHFHLTPFLIFLPITLIHIPPSYLLKYPPPSYFSYSKHTLICAHFRQTFFAFEAPVSSPVSRAGRENVYMLINRIQSEDGRRVLLDFKGVVVIPFLQESYRRFRLEIFSCRRLEEKYRRRWENGSWTADCTDTIIVSMASDHGRIGKGFMLWHWTLQSQIFMISTSIRRKSVSSKTMFGSLTTMTTACPTVTLLFIAWNHWNPS